MPIEVRNKSFSPKYLTDKIVLKSMETQLMQDNITGSPYNRAVVLAVAPANRINAPVNQKMSN